MQAGSNYNMKPFWGTYILSTHFVWGREETEAEAEKNKNKERELFEMIDDYVEQA